MLEGVAEVGIQVVRWLATDSRQSSWMDFVSFDTAGIPRRQWVQPRRQSAAGRCDVLLVHGQGGRWESVDGESVSLDDTLQRTMKGTAKTKP